MTIVKLKIGEKKNARAENGTGSERKMRKGRMIFRRNDENEKTDKITKEQTVENKGFY